MSHYLHLALHGLKDLSEMIISDNQLEAVEKTIKGCAITAAITGVGAGMLPGTGGVIATAASVGAIWGMYVAINEKLGISISSNLLKSLASAILTNLLATGGSLLLLFAATKILQWIPGIHIAATAIDAMIIYISVFASGVLYIRLLTDIFKAKGSFDISKDEIKTVAKDIVANADVKGIIKEGKEAYMKDKKEGKLDTE